jgi:nucleoside-diphosphate-sugar epimerase
MSRYELELPSRMVSAASASLRSRGALPLAPRVLLTGGSGSIGRWILALLGELKHLGVCPGLQVTVISRRAPESSWLASRRSWLTWYPVDISQPFELEGGFSHVVHAAMPASNHSGGASMQAVAQAGVVGTINLGVALVEARQSLRSVVNVSSGAVYGEPPANVLRLREGDQFPMVLSGVASVYAHSKASAELLLADSLSGLGIDLIQARVFSVMGPGLEMPGRLALSEFVYRAARGKAVVVKGTGSPMRSYLPLPQVAEILLGLLFAERSGTVNVGSDSPMSVYEWGALVSEVADVPLEWLGGADTVQRANYCPDTERLRDWGFAAEVNSPQQVLAEWLEWEKLSLHSSH